MDETGNSCAKVR